jgi:hypothetical protein
MENPPNLRSAGGFQPTGKDIAKRADLPGSGFHSRLVGEQPITVNWLCIVKRRLNNKGASLLGAIVRQPGNRIETAPRTRPRRRSRLVRTLLRAAAALIVLVALAAGILWYFGPELVAPVDNFVQGPGGAVAYISMARQIAEQAPEFWTGKDVRLTFTESEFSGMLSSALLSGRQPDSPIRRVRSSLLDNRIQVETILSLHDERVPAQFRDTPIGVTVRLRPTVTPAGQIQFEISRASLGRIPVPTALIRWAGRHLPVSTPGFDAAKATFTLPVSEMITNQFGRNVQLKDFAVTDQDLTLSIAMSQHKK